MLREAAIVVSVVVAAVFAVCKFVASVAAGFDDINYCDRINV